MPKCVVRRTLLWLHLWFYVVQGLTNALWKNSVFQWPIAEKAFFIVIHRFSLVKAAMNARRICKMRYGVRKTLSISSLIQLSKCAMNILRSYLNFCTIVNWKIRKHSNSLKGSQRMGVGGRRIFLKTYRASLFNEDLSNEPHFGRIHLAGQHL